MIGNKIDVDKDKRVISSKRATTFGQSKGGIPCFETSAKEAVNVEQAFEGRPVASLSFTDAYNVVVARNALAQEESEDFSGDFSDPININIANSQDGCAC